MPGTNEQKVRTRISIPLPIFRLLCHMAADRSPSINVGDVMRAAIEAYVATYRPGGNGRSSALSSRDESSK